MSGPRPKSAGPRRRVGKFKVTFGLGALLAVVFAGWFALQTPAHRDEIAKLARNYFDRDKHIALADAVWDVWQLSYGDAFVSTRLPAARDKRHLYGGVPRSTVFPRTTAVLGNSGYVVGYSEELESPLWAAYHVRDLAQIKPPPERPGKFEVDTRTTSRVAPSAYTGSGYDRGHLAPNYSIATRYGEAAQRETFLMSNVTPQRHALNAGLWKQLEMKIATSYAGRFGEVWVLAGPVFGAKPARLRNGTAIPEAFFLIVADESDGRLRLLALLVPQDATETDAADRYLTTVDEIERRTGLDFLPDLDDAAENALEARRAERVW